MAGIRQPIQDVINKLSTLQLPNGSGIVTNVYCALYNQQDRDIANGVTYDFPLPAIFVELLKPENFLPIGGKVNLYASDLLWNIHLLHEQYDAQDGTMDQDLNVYDQFRDKVLTLFSLFAPTACGPMVMQMEDPDFDHNNLDHHILTFKCHYIDSKGSPYDPNSVYYKYTTPPTNIEIDISNAHHSDFTNDQTSYKQPYIVKEHGT